MWNLRNHAWAISLSGAAVTILWAIGPVRWVVEKDSTLTYTDFWAWVLAGWQYKYITPVALLPLATLISLALCHRYWPRIRARKNVAVKQLYEQNKTMEVELNMLREDIIQRENKLDDLFNDYMVKKKALSELSIDLEGRKQAIETRKSEIRMQEKEVGDALKEIKLKEQNLRAQEHTIVQKETVIERDRQELDVLLTQARKQVAVAKQQATTILDKAEKGARDLLAWTEEKITRTTEIEDPDHQKKCQLVLDFFKRKEGQVRRPDLLASRILEGGGPEYDLVLESLSNRGLISCDKSSEKKIDWKYILISAS